MKAPAREHVVDALVLVALKLGFDALVLRAGFTHVSDDDYSRTVIAQQFAHVPHLDPSGTSWLPLPFWIEGAAMALFGKTLAVARGVAVALGAATVVAPYAAMRAAGMRRIAALAATGVAMAAPWNVWLGVATVPEGWTGALVGAALVAMPVDRARPWAAAGLLAGSLARYETWPACAAFVALCAWRATRRGRVGQQLAWAVVAAAGPLAWVAWNAHAHGSALHFITRVTTFRQAAGGSSMALADKIAGYPLAFVSEFPVALLLGLVAVAMQPLPGARARWRWPAAAAVAVLATLVWGDVNDGAPTHHPARALLPIVWVVFAAGVDAAFALGDRVRASPAVASGITCAALALAAVIEAGGAQDFPGSKPDEARKAQIARGLDLRARHVPAATVTPCAFEHFALLAAWGEPWRATVLPRTNAAVTATCPLVVER